MIEQKIKEFVTSIEQHKFYEAHEALEEVWFPKRFEKDPEVQFLKGCINAAVSFELIKRGRIPQSKRVWANYLKYRQLLYKIDSKHYNSYHNLVRYLDSKGISIPYLQMDIHTDKQN